MKPKFKVSLDVQEGYNADYDTHYTYLQKVTPESLSAHCPHCGVYSTMKIEATVKRLNWRFDLICTCTHCEETVFVQAEYLTSNEDVGIAPPDSTNVISIYPQRRKIDIPAEVPEKYGNDYREAVLVLDQSPKASAALSRRILQNVLEQEFDISRRSLNEEIIEFIGLKDVPSYLAESVDAIRAVGNFAAHPLKDTNTGEIVEVEPGEAEWLLGVIEQLLDFAFVQPQKLKERRKNLNAKLQSAGKPALKASTS